ncbi:MAG: GTP cyclohydrolase I FolE [Bacteroidia bacterium]|nr:GTP cyclohydrolase I FolE [Bacteroidia bacterium]MCX7651641.1 GTP cyclohydrolase I FolE [Bacteroidia bacterium]MDW8415967.1 GTP cyclohydrolase I FolE [Bacteroidia bacterium]
MDRKPEYANGHDTPHSCGSCLSTEIEATLSQDEREAQIAYHFAEIMRILGLDLSDPSLRETPKRVSKMYLRELFIGLNPAYVPNVRLFPNTYSYNRMVVEKDIRVRSVCEHHFVPIIGVAHVAYIPRDYVVGLSKLNRIVDYFARRPQVQERMTQQIADFLETNLDTPDVAVIIDAKHYCVSMRGIQDEASRTLTYALRGKFEEEDTKDTFLRLVGL